MKLFIDVGNSLLKWRVNEDAAKLQVYNHGLVKALEGVRSQVGKVGSVYVSSVKSEEFNADLTSLVNDLWGVVPVLAKSHSRQAGVTCAYQQPERLGVDRWLAMLAAYAKAKTAVCVVDCGTATTIDVVSADGVHQGGFIIPGAKLMERGLLADTDKIIFSDAERSARSMKWGESTAEAVINGIYFSQIAIIEKCIARCKEQFAMIQTILCGGYGAEIHEDLSGDFIYVPDLVLDGLSIYSENMDFS